MKLSTKKGIITFFLVWIIGLLVFSSLFVFMAPRVIMRGAQFKLTNTDVITNEGKAPLNSMSHTNRYPTAKDRIIVRLNTDTFYSSAWFKLNKEPYILHVPKTDGRYYSLQFNDAWTNAFHYVGKRATGSEEGYYAVVGPRWKGELPEGLEIIKSPSNIIWVIGRTMYFGEHDIKNVKAIQEEITFTPLSEFTQ